jgi:hypothetical protein
MSKRWWRPARLVFLTARRLRPGPHSMRAGSAMSLRRGSLPISWGLLPCEWVRPRGWRRLRYLAALLDIQLSFRNSRTACSNEAFRILFRSHAAGGSVRRNSFINLA